MKKIFTTWPGRISVSMLLGLIFGVLVSEGSILINPEHPTRPPETIELVIPPGTAQKVATGQAVPSLPVNLSFVQGDVLKVKNEDSSSHQLGPLWVPAGTTGVLNLQTPEQYSYACSFQPTKYIGLDVRPALTWEVRLQGILAVGLPTAVMIFLYSLAFTRKVD